jgi:hypothetical protein
MSRLNTEFNYRYQVIGETVWEKINTLKGFLNSRKRAAVLERVGELKNQAKYEELKNLKKIKALPHVVLELEAEIMEMESFFDEAKENYAENKKEIVVIEKLLKELYTLAEPTRVNHQDGTPFTDDEMFEVNAANEFTVTIAKEMHAEILANGRPSAAKIRNAMSNPITWAAIKQIGMIPEETPLITANVDPTKIQLHLPPNQNEVIENKQEQPEIIKKQLKFS